jgi:hypothetical protein
VLDRIEAEAECIRKRGLRHAQPLAYGFDIDILGHAYLIAGLLSSKKRVNLVQAGHQVFKHFAHALPPCRVKISSARFSSSLRSFLVGYGLGMERTADAKLSDCG